MEHAWLSALMEKYTLRLLRRAGEDEWDWLFVSVPHLGQVWLSRVRTTGGDQLLPIRETISRVDEADAEMVVRRCEIALDQFEARETVQLSKMVEATVSVRGLLLPERAGGDALFMKENPRAFSRYWLRYEPREASSWPEGHFDISRSPEAIVDSVLRSR